MTICELLSASLGRARVQIDIFTWIVVVGQVLEWSRYPSTLWWCHMQHDASAYEVNNQWGINRPYEVKIDWYQRPRSMSPLLESQQTGNRPAGDSNSRDGGDWYRLTEVGHQARGSFQAKNADDSPYRSLGSMIQASITHWQFGRTKACGLTQIYFSPIDLIARFTSWAFSCFHILPHTIGWNWKAHISLSGRLIDYFDSPVIEWLLLIVLGIYLFPRISICGVLID